MNIQVTSKDEIGLITESSATSSDFTNTPSTHKSSHGPGTSEATDRPDTIHYLSPATTARSECEGDLDYQQFYYRPEYPQLEDFKTKASPSTSSSTATLPCDENVLQRTVAIVKPEALCYKDVVLRAIVQGGFQIVHQRTVHLSPEQVSEVYEKYYGTPTFPHMVVTVSAAPILVLSLQTVNAVEKWKTMIGPAGTLREEWFFPRSVRHRFGLMGDFPNALHASEGANDAKRENRYFYPRDIQEPLPLEPATVKDYIYVFIKPSLLKGLTEIVLKKPLDPVISLAEWLLLHNPNQPDMADFIALTPT